jgi:hypothetical protein
MNSALGLSKKYRLRRKTLASVLAILRSGIRSWSADVVHAESPNATKSLWRPALSYRTRLGYNLRDAQRVPFPNSGTRRAHATS